MYIRAYTAKYMHIYYNSCFEKFTIPVKVSCDFVELCCKYTTLAILQGS